jgi:FkbM family methyltransferase
MIEQNFPKDIKGVIQIGASSGQQLKLFIDNDVKDMILFEPCDKSFSELEKTAEPYKTQANIILSNYILSNKTEEAKFYIGQNEHNSSLLDLHPQRPGLHKAINNHDRYEIKKSISLDDYFEDTKIDLDLYDFIFMDVQGAEHIVLEGALTTLKKIKYVYLEVSFAEIYAGTLLYEDMVKYLATLGFEVVWVDTSGHMNQGDILVKRVVTDDSVLNFLYG